MGLLKKLFGGSGQDISLEGLVKNVTNVAEKAVSKIESYAGDSSQQKNGGIFSSYNTPSQPQNNNRYDEPSGFSWGPYMPQEENQYNYSGNYVDYFAHIFREDFPAYQAVSEKLPKSTSTIFTLYEGARKALVVELKSEKSEANRFRKACQAQGIPYLRFYYDHDGWWNTREYVVTRVRSALGR